MMMTFQQLKMTECLRGQMPTPTLLPCKSPKIAASLGYATTGWKTSPSTAGCLRGFTKRCIWRNRRDSGPCSEKEELKESCSIRHREGIINMANSHIDTLEKFGNSAAEEITADVRLYASTFGPTTRHFGLQYHVKWQEVQASFYVGGGGNNRDRWETLGLNSRQILVGNLS